MASLNLRAKQSSSLSPPPHFDHIHGPTRECQAFPCKVAWLISLMVSILLVPYSCTTSSTVMTLENSAMLTVLHWFSRKPIVKPNADYSKTTLDLTPPSHFNALQYRNLVAAVRSHANAGADILTHACACTGQTSSRAPVLSKKASARNLWSFAIQPRAYATEAAPLS